MQALGRGHRLGAEQTGPTGGLSGIGSWLRDEHAGKLLKRSPTGPSDQPHAPHVCMLAVGNTTRWFYLIKNAMFHVWCFFYLKCSFLLKNATLKFLILPAVEGEGLNIFKSCGFIVFEENRWYCNTVCHARHTKFVHYKSAITFLINMYLCCANKYIAFLHSAVMGQLLAHTGPNKDLKDSVVLDGFLFIFSYFLYFCTYLSLCHI